MRSIGSINIRIGLVNIPLKICSFLNYQGINFKQLCPTCENPISYKRVCSNCNQEVDYSQIKSGFQISKDNIIVIDKESFKIRLETKVIAVIKTNSEYEFITEKCYLLMPDKLSKKQYFLLRKILSDESKSLVIEFTLRSKIHLAILKPILLNGVCYLMLKEILYADKIKEIESPTEEALTEEETELGKQLFELIEKKVENTNYLDIKDRRIELLEKLLKGEIKPIEIEKIKNEDLMRQLKESVEITKIGRKVSKKQLERS
jgi:DNA end-binding protein Ku